MFSRFAFVACIFALAFATLTFAVPEPMPTPMEKRQIGSVIDSLTSDVGSVFTQVTSGAGSVFTQVTSGAGSVASDITSIGGNIATSVTSIGGHAATIVTSLGGQAITLATDGFGEATTFAGSVYNIVTPTGTPNAASSFRTPSSNLFTGLTAVLVSMLFGVWVVL